MSSHTINIDNDLPTNIIYIKNFLSSSEIKNIKHELSFINWKNCIRKNNNNRCQIYYNEDMKNFDYNWIHKYDRWSSNKYDFWLKYIQTKISDYIKSNFHIKHNFNSCLINKYNNGSQYIGYHTDKNELLDDNPTIACLSIGCSRTISIKKINKYNFEFNDIDILLEENSLFIMSGTCQKYFVHSILKDNTTEPRWSLTFRYIN